MAPMVDPQPVTISSLLAEHHSDPHLALAHLVSRHNRLVSDLAALRQAHAAALQASDRAAQENHQLWRSLKALNHSGSSSASASGPAATAPSPRPAALRHNSSDHSTSSSTATSTSTSRGLRRGLSSEGAPHAAAAAARLDLSGLSLSSSSTGGGGSSATSAHSSPRTADTADFRTGSPFLPPPPPPPPHDHAPAAPRSAEPSPRFASAAQFSPVGRAKAATPPPPSSLGSPRGLGVGLGVGLGAGAGAGAAVGHEVRRKTSSLDLGRGGADGAGAGAGAGAKGPPLSPGDGAGAGGMRVPQREDEQLLPRTPAQGDRERGVDPRRRRSSPRIMMTGSSSMPLLSDPAMDRRLLPSIQPVSPFFVGNSGDDSATSRTSSLRDPNSAPSGFGSSSSAAAGEHLQQQLSSHPARGASERDRRERDRTLSSSGHSAASASGSSSNTLATAFPEHFATSTSTSTSSAAPHPPDAGLTSSTSLLGLGARERRPSAPSSRLAHAAAGAESAAGANASASAPTSRRPSALSFGPAASSSSSSSTGAQTPTSTSTSAQPVPPHPPRTPTPRAPAPQPTLSPGQLPHVRVRVPSSVIRSVSERGKGGGFGDGVVFVVEVSVAPPPASSSPEGDPPPWPRASATWRLEKKHSDVLSLDAQVRQRASRAEVKALAPLPDKALFKDHAPHRSDQRKVLVERYLAVLVGAPLRERERDKTRYYVLSPGSALAYYDAPGGTKLGEIPLQSAAIGRQSSSTTSAASSSAASTSNGDNAADSDAYLHAFLIRTRTDEDRGHGSHHHHHHEADHILCAENDDMRDRWVHALTTVQPRTGGAPKPNGVTVERALPDAPTLVATEPSPDSPTRPTAAAAAPPKERHRSGSGPPSSTSAAAQAQSAAQAEAGVGGSGSGGLSARSAGDLPPSVSLPSDLHALARGMPALDGAGAKKIATISEAGEAGTTSSASAAAAAMGRSATTGGNQLQAPSSRRPSGDRPLSPSRVESTGSAGAAPPAPPPPPPPHPASTKYSASDVSGPMNAVPLPSGYDFKKSERQKKTKSSFWNFASRGSNSNSGGSSSGDRNAATSPGGHGQPASGAAAAPARPVFGVPLAEAVAISRIRPGLELPAIVYRCVEYLEAKNAEHEEGIFRLSGSANVIRLLKERFNAEGDVNLLQSAEYYDPHAVAGLLKQYLRELPDHLLTRELHNEFLRVIDLRDRRDRVNALGKLVARLPIEEYTLFRFFFAHLCLIAQNADTSKMNLRNLGIVFAPTLAIPQPLFSLFLVEFDLIFAVETETGAARPIMVGEEPAPADPSSAIDKSPRSEGGGQGNRNSQMYEASGAGELEQKLEKLREHDEADDEAPEGAAARGPDTDPTLAAAERGTATDLSDSSFANPALSPLGLGAPLRSPGLPSSPRPGATF